MFIYVHLFTCIIFHGHLYSYYIFFYRNMFIFIFIISISSYRFLISYGLHAAQYGIDMDLEVAAMS